MAIIVAVANDNVQIQIWIGADDKLPRLSWLTFAHAPQKPRRMAEFSDWRLDGPVDTAPPKAEGAGKIEFARPEVRNLSRRQMDRRSCTTG
jgi:hypothetical protein